MRQSKLIDFRLIQDISLKNTLKYDLKEGIWIKRVEKKYINFYKVTHKSLT